MSGAMEKLAMWTVYDHPKDFPDKFVARKWLVATEPVATDEHLVSDSLEWLRRRFEEMGLYCIPRNPGDDPNIVEVWL